MRILKKRIKIGDRAIGGTEPVLIQSMCNSKTSDAAATIAQIKKLESEGCDIVRVSVPDAESAKAIATIKKSISIPLVADIHFDYRLALMSIEAGVDKLRINPGNIGSEAKIKELVSSAKYNKVPIRIGVNSGSLDKRILQKHGSPTPMALVESALKHVAILEKFGFEDIVLSLKSSSAKMSVEANTLLSKECAYPIHLGVTECGSGLSGAIKATAGISALLLKGIGDTIRVSVTGTPWEEIPICKEILSACETRRFGVNIIACPTCARCQVDLKSIVDEVKEITKSLDDHIDIAIMGCQVNGPGEARGADIGIAGAPKDALLFVKGKVKSRHPYSEIKSALIAEIENIRKTSKLKIGE